MGTKRDMWRILSRKFLVSSYLVAEAFFFLQENYEVKRKLEWLSIVTKRACGCLLVSGKEQQNGL